MMQEVDYDSISISGTDPAGIERLYRYNVPDNESGI